MIKIKPRFKKLKAANLPNSKKLAQKYHHGEIIKLFYNENKFGCSPQIKSRIQINSPHIYPEYKEPELTKKLSQLFEINQDYFYISNGSDAILDCIPTLFASKSQNNNVIIPELTFGRIETTCLVEGVKIKKVPLVDGKIDLPQMLAAIDLQTSIIYLVNPDMPTGTLNYHNDVLTFLTKVPEHILVVIDEAYAEYAYGIVTTYQRDKEIIKKFQNVIITHTWSKLYAIAAFRIGFMIAQPYIVNLFRKAYQYLPVNKYSLQAAERALSDLPYYQDVIAKTNKEKLKYYAVLDKLALKYFKSYANFIYIEAPNNQQFAQYLIEKYAVAIRCIRTNALRITIGTPAENALVLKGLQEFYV